MPDTEPTPPDDEADDESEQAEAFPATTAISYYGTDFDVDGLVRRLGKGDIVIPRFDPETKVGESLSGFQRRFVWRRFQMDRFIESLLLGFPIPGIFLVQQPDKKMLVLDGQQRLITLQCFYNGLIDQNTVFALKDVADEFKDLKYKDLSDDLRRAIDNTFIHATIVKYDPTLGGDDAVYQVFERLNTGGTNLYPQEIRVALYNGEFTTMLRSLNSDANWRELYGPASLRHKDQELILRFIAFSYALDKYERPLKGFLNKFLREHRHLENLQEQDIRGQFALTCSAIKAGIGRRAFRAKQQLNAALVDAILVAVSSRLAKGPITDYHAMGVAFDGLLASEDFLGLVTRSTSDEDRVKSRINQASAAFTSVP